MYKRQGGGKSTIANLLTRFWDVKGGRVLVRGKDVREVKLSDLMDHISICLLYTSYQEQRRYQTQLRKGAYLA